ncbi:MAG: DNA polymerase, partial [Thermodesulfobacteriota bacterium]
MAEENAVYLIDGSAYLHRAFHAIRGLSNSQGLPTNAVFGMANMLLALLRDKKPRYVAVCFDARGKTFRHDLYPAYKANRPPMDPSLAVQIPYARKVVEGLRLPLLEVPGVEADDVIATLAAQAEAKGFPVVMVTGDKDFNQLVTDGVVVWDPMKDQIRDKAFLEKAFGLAPPQLLQVQALSGDSADNIPGVPGVGEKTAVGLIQEFGTLENLYQNLEKVGREKLRATLAANRDQAFLSRTLAEISKTAPVAFSADDFAVKAPDTGALTLLFRELNFAKLLETFSQKTDVAQKKYHTLLSEGELADLVKTLARAGRFSVDTETTSTDPMRARLVGMSFCAEPSEAWYVPVGHTYLGAPEQVPVRRALELLAPVLSDPGLAKVGQNIKYDWIVLSRHGAELAGVSFDTMVASYLLNPGLRSHGLDQIAQTYLSVTKIKYEDVTGAGARAVTFDLAPVEKAAPYACEDADTTLAASRKLAPLLDENGLSDLYRDIEMPLVRVLKNMEMRGVAVDQDFLAGLSREFSDKMAGIEARIYALAGERFNISSPQQLGFVLFEKLQLPVQKKTKKKTGYSTDVSVLTELSAAHELPAQVLSYRSLAKLKSTYADALLTLVNLDTGRVHTSFNQNVTATG